MPRISKRDQSPPSEDIDPNGPNAIPVDDSQPEAEAPPMPDVPFMVRATMPGTYPDPGKVRARWRNVGDVFQVRKERDFSKHWMVRVGEEEAVAAVASAKPVPQTTGHQGKLVDSYLPR